MSPLTSAARVRLGLLVVVSVHAAPAILAVQASPPPISCADTTRRELGHLVGAFDVTAVFRAGADAWDSTGAVVEVTPRMGGCVLEEHFRGRRYGAPYEYLALWSAHGGAGGPIQRSFVHSQHGLLSVSQGRRTGDTIVVEDSAFVRGRWIFQRLMLWTVPGVGLASENRRSEDGRASWFVTQRTRYVRRRGRAERARS